MPLRMDAHRLLARQRDLHRPPGHAREERRLRLYGEVFLAAERAAARDLLDDDVVGGHAEEGGDLAAIVEDALAAAEDAQLAAVERLGDRAFGFAGEMVDVPAPPGG